MCVHVIMTVCVVATSNHYRIGLCQWSCSMPVTIWLGDCLRTGKLSRYTIKHPGQISLPSLRSRYHWVPAYEVNADVSIFIVNMCYSSDSHSTLVLTVTKFSMQVIGHGHHYVTHYIYSSFSLYQQEILATLQLLSHILYWFIILDQSSIVILYCFGQWQFTTTQNMKK